MLGGKRVWGEEEGFWDFVQNTLKKNPADVKPPKAYTGTRWALQNDTWEKIDHEA